MCETHGDRAAELPSGDSAGVSHTLTYESAALFFLALHVPRYGRSRCHTQSDGEDDFSRRNGPQSHAACVCVCVSLHTFSIFLAFVTKGLKTKRGRPNSGNIVGATAAFSPHPPIKIRSFHSRHQKMQVQRRRRSHLSLSLSTSFELSSASF